MENNQNENNLNLKNFYNSSVLNNNSISDLCNNLTSTETLDINVEKFLTEMGDNFIETILDDACVIAKHKNNDNIDIEDLATSIEKNFDIFEPNKYTPQLNLLKSNFININPTYDHKKRVELTKEETKNVNL
jgi:transcription initiation factor TFIID subunit 12